MPSETHNLSREYSVGTLLAAFVCVCERACECVCACFGWSI